MSGRSNFLQHQRKTAVSRWWSLLAASLSVSAAGIYYYGPAALVNRSNRNISSGGLATSLVVATLIGLFEEFKHGWHWHLASSHGAVNYRPFYSAVNDYVRLVLTLAQRLKASRKK